MNGFGRDEKKEKKEKSRASVMTRETVGMTLLLFSAVDRKSVVWERVCTCV